MLRKLSHLLYALLFISLAACTLNPEPMVFGVKESTWQNMSTPQREVIMVNYNHQRELAEYPATIPEINTAGFIFDSPTYNYY